MFKATCLISSWRQIDDFIPNYCSVICLCTGKWKKRQLICWFWGIGSLFPDIRPAVRWALLCSVRRSGGSGRSQAWAAQLPLPLPPPPQARGALARHGEGTAWPLQGSLWFSRARNVPGRMENSWGWIQEQPLLYPLFLTILGGASSPLALGATAYLKPD